MLFDFSYYTAQLDEIYENACKRQAIDCISEIHTVEHKKIDEIVFVTLEYNQAKRKKIIAALMELINFRVAKSKGKREKICY